MHHRDDDDDNNRFRVGSFSAGEIALFKDIAEAAAESTAQKMFVMMGHDPKDPRRAQLDAAWTRRMRERADGVVGKIALTVAGLSAAGAINVIWTGIKSALATTTLPPH